MNAVALTKPASSARAAAVAVTLAAITLAVFGQTVRFPFMNYDDNAYIYANPVVQRGLTWPGVAWAFTYAGVGHWHPLTWLSHMLDCQIYGVNPAGHHLTNVLLHAIAVVLLFYVLRQLTGCLGRSAFAAALFAIHPLRAESVAWISERKDVLSGVFFMLTLMAYTRYARQPSHRRYAVVAIAFALGLLCKNTLVTLPFLMLLLDWWPLRRWQTTSPAALAQEKIPLLLLSIGSCLATVLSPEKVPNYLQLFWLDRVKNAVAAYAIYLKDMIYPAGLTAPYPFPPHGLAWPTVGLALVVLVPVTAAATGLRRSQPYFLTGWLWYLGASLPMIGLVQISYYARADRYTYLPQIGLAVAVAWGAADLATIWKNRPAVSGVLMAGTIGALMCAAWVQTGYWSDRETFWRHALACTTDNYMAHDRLAEVWLSKGKKDEARTNYEEAVKINPNDDDARNNLGVILLQQGRAAKAIAQFQNALAVDPSYADAHYNLGLAMADFHRWDEAAKEFQAAIVFKPDLAQAHYHLGQVLQQTGARARAVTEYEQALRLKPDSAEAENALASLLHEAGALKEAIPHFQNAVRLKPDDESVHFNLAGTLAQAGRIQEAMAEYHTALQLKSKDIEALNNLAWLLATAAPASLRNGAEAVQLATSANQLALGKNAAILGTLAAALAETGQFDEACRKAGDASARALAGGQTALAARLKNDLMVYQSGHSLSHP